MNYIPGFSNYLEASVPEYGPAPIMDAPRQPAVMPMTTEAVAPYTLSGLSPEALAGLYALTANNIGGPMGGGMEGLPSLGAGYTPQFEEELITAPVSNKGNPTAYGGDNQFYIQPNELVRVVDRGTNSVIFEGVGPDAAREAVKIGQNLTDTLGRKADYQIQAGLTPDKYVPVANEKFNKTDLQNIANAVGTAAPLAAAFIPGLNLGVLGSIGAGAGLGGASAALKGDDILKGAAMGGLSAAGAQYLGPAFEAGGRFGTTLAPRLATAIGSGIGSTAGGLVTGQNLKNSLLGGVASGAASYLSPDIAKGLGIGGGSSASTSTSGGGGDIVVSGYRPTNIGLTLGGSQNKIQQALKPKTEAPFEGITAIGNRLGGLSAVNLGGNRFGAPGEGASPLDRLTEAEMDQEEIDVLGNKIIRAAPVSVPLSPDVLAGMAEFEKNPIISEGSKIERPATSIPNLDFGLIDRLSGMENYKEPIDVIGSKRVEPTSVSVVPPIGSVVDTLPPMDLKSDPALTDKKKLGLEEYLRLAGLASGLIGGAAGGSGQTGTYGGTGTGRLNPIFSAKLPAAGGLGNIGANRTLRPLGDVDWLTYGTRPELNFFDYSPRTGPAPVTQPAAPAPATQPVPNNPAGPAMYVPDDMRFAEGGAFAAKRGGSSKRTEFAVNGPGTGRSDEIPAVLSDGEYVIDAETVALLGDGSSKAGAKKLDDLRVKVRKHKGEKLAKGRFSANAKNPEAYLSGGRV